MKSGSQTIRKRTLRRCVLSIILEVELCRILNLVIKLIYENLKLIRVITPLYNHDHLPIIQQYNTSL